MEKLDLVDSTVEKIAFQRTAMLEAMLRVYLRENKLGIGDIELVQRTDLAKKEVVIFVRKREIQ